MSQPLWTPSRQRVVSSNLYSFLLAMRARHDIPDGEYGTLQRWSIDNLETFWEEAWLDAEVKTRAEHRTVLVERSMPVVRFEPDRQWFPGARFNFARHLLRVRDELPALIAEGEAAPRRTVTYSDLYEMVAQAAGGLQALGVAPEDRIAAYLPNTVEAVVAMLATTALGAVFSSTSPDFGYEGVLERFGQIDPKVLICADGYQYNGKRHSTLDKAKQLGKHIPSIERTVLVPFLDPKVRTPRGMLSWKALLKSGKSAGDPKFPAFPFDHPAFILFSSGTTGAPKCIVHGAGGTLLKHHVEHKLQTDVKPADRLFYFTTCGWMMWNWLVSGLAQGATLVLYDGSPTYPDVGRLFRLAEETQITAFGTSPKFLGACRQAGLRPGKSHNLSAMRTILSTGAPLEPELFDWVYERVKSDVHLASISGGTDIMGCFMLGNPFQAVHRGEIQGAALGVDLASYDESGRPRRKFKGELVCRQPFPSMPIGLWGDPDGRKYRETYFDRFPGVWRHGDFVEINGRGGVIVHGRSDATLNPGGVRIGTAEIYRIVEALPEVQDSLVVGQRWEGDVRVILFVVLMPKVKWTGKLERKIRGAIRSQATPRHVPAKILPIAEVPVTLNGKKVEVSVTRILQGEPVHNRDALANPHSLRQFESLSLD